MKRKGVDPGLGEELKVLRPVPVRPKTAHPDPEDVT
jgi:hypothetical protein